MRRPEQSLQISVASFLRVALRPPTIWTAFPAGGGGKTRGAFLKAMGLQAGWPDILIIYPHEGPQLGCRVLGIELKSAKGRMSDHQQAVRHDFITCGAAYREARSVEEVESHLRYWRVPLHASVGAKKAEGLVDGRGTGASVTASEPLPTTGTSKAAA